jgi:adenylylsulfate kinase-like enzyme
LITWIIGPSGSGKTTLAKRIQEYHKNTVVLDSDILREILKHPSHHDLLLNMAFLSKLLSEQGFDVAVSGIINEEKTKSFITKYINPQWVNLDES